MIIVRPTPASVAATDELFQKLTALGERLGPQLVDAAINFAHDVIADIFKGEGYSGIVGSRAWAGLAPRTQRERAHLNLPGIGPAHPILRRTYVLMESLVDESSPLNVTERGRAGPGRWTGRLGTTDSRFEELQTGRGSPTPMPARPMWPVGDAEARFAKMLETWLVWTVDDTLSKDF